jgi:hypothetical protein
LPSVSTFTSTYTLQLFSKADEATEYILLEVNRVYSSGLQLNHMHWTSNAAEKLAACCSSSHCNCCFVQLQHVADGSKCAIPVPCSAAAQKYVGPVPIVTHMHGNAGVQDSSDGYTEAWFLPNAGDIPADYAKVGNSSNFADTRCAAAAFKHCAMCAGYAQV